MSLLPLSLNPMKTISKKLKAFKQSFLRLDGGSQFLFVILTILLVPFGLTFFILQSIVKYFHLMCSWLLHEWAESGDAREQFHS